MLMIKKESSEYVENGVYYSYKSLKLFGIKIYTEIFTTSNMNVLQRFCEIQDDEDKQKEYPDPVVVTGFKKEQ